MFYIVNPVFVSIKEKPVIPAQEERLYRDVKALTSINPPRNFKNLNSLNKAADYIFNQFQQAGYKPNFQAFKVSGKEYRNVIAVYGDKNHDRIIIGAHYDVFGNQDGADDNASAVAGLLEIARIVKELKPRLKHYLEFVAYTLEEPPFFGSNEMGSSIHAKSVANQRNKIKMMICLEMIGFFSEQKGSQKYPMQLLKLFYPSRGDFILIVGRFGKWTLVRKIKKLMIKGSTIDVRSINAPGFAAGIDYSDHRNYWKNKIPAVMITDTAFYRNPNYHKKTDTIDTLDFKKMAEVVKGVYWAIRNFK